MKNRRKKKQIGISYLKHGKADNNDGDGQNVILEPLFAFFQATVLIDLVDDDVLADAGSIAHAKAALSIVQVFWKAAAGWHAARLDPWV